MKLTAEEVNDFKDAIFINFPQIGNEFEMLLNSTGNPVFDLIEGQRIARIKFKGIMWQISTLKQALIKNSETYLIVKKMNT